MLPRVEPRPAAASMPCRWCLALIHLGGPQVVQYAGDHEAMPFRECGEQAFSLGGGEGAGCPGDDLGQIVAGVVD